MASDRTRIPAERSALADSLWELWDGDYVDPEWDAERLIRILRRRGWQLERVA